MVISYLTKIFLFSFNLFPFIIFCSVFLLTSVQTVTIVLIINTIFFFIFMFNMSLSTWMGFWFLISYNSGILVMLLYLTSMSKYIKSFWIFFVINFLFVYNMNKNFIDNNFLFMYNIEESHFMVLEQKNFFAYFFCFLLIISLLLTISKLLNKSKMSSRILLLFSL